MGFAVIAYTLLSIFVIGGGGSYLIRMDRSTAGALFILGSLGISIFFGMRWFNGAKLKGSELSGSWPPSINLCPDYFEKSVDTSGNVVCTDTQLLYGKGGLASIPSAYAVNGKRQSFKTVLSNSGPMSPADINTLITANPQIRWEGIWDGQRLSGKTF